MESILAAAEILISRWDINTTSKMLFENNNEEVGMYMETVDNLQQLMEYLSAVDKDAEKCLIRAQRLMKMAMIRLEKEFHKILLSNSEHLYLDRESSSRPSCRSSSEDSVSKSTSSDGDDDRGSHSLSTSNCLSVDRSCEFNMLPSDAVADLRSIAQRMAKSGYAGECVRVFVLCRKSVVEESIYNLGVDKVKLNDIRKMERKFLDEKIRKWISAAKICIRILFGGEKRLCDEVFEGLHQMRDSCFAEIAGSSTRRVFSFAEAVATASRAPERIFRVLDLYETFAHLMPDIEATYCQHSSCPSGRELAHTIVARLAETARLMLTEFDKAIEKDKSKAPIVGGNVHPLTRYVMNYLSFLSDYKETLVNIIEDAPEESPDHNPSATLSDRIEWTTLLLQCKLEKKADLYKDVALSYLFLMNNLNYIVQKVNGSELSYILGEEWLRDEWKKVGHYAVNYERSAWMKVLSCLTDQEEVPMTGGVSSGQAVKEKLREFNAAMEVVKKRHSGWVVADVELREKVGISITEKLIPLYTSFLSRFRDRFESDALIKYTPEELQDCVLDMLMVGPCPRAQRDPHD